MNNFKKRQSKIFQTSVFLPSMNPSKVILTVTAHPDDEVLGFGGTSYALSKKGYTVFNLILSGQVDARQHRPNVDDLHRHTANAQEIIGAEKPILGPFPNIKFNTVPHLDLVQFIEKYIEEIQPGKGRHKRGAVVITELPYQLSKAGWIEKLAEQVNDGKITGIADIRDESDREGMRVVVELRRDANPETVLAELQRRTALQSNFGAILLALVMVSDESLRTAPLGLSFFQGRNTSDLSLMAAASVIVALPVVLSTAVRAVASLSATTAPVTSTTAPKSLSVLSSVTSARLAPLLAVNVALPAAVIALVLA